MMTTTHVNNSHASTAESAAMLRWDFLRGHQAVTCAVRANGTQSYDVCVMPHWDMSSSVVERFDHPMAALRRHAEIASSFKEAGFSVSRTQRRLVQH